MYTDTTTLKRYLGISGTADDTLLTELITRAQAIIDRWTGRTFEAATDTTRRFDATDPSGGALFFGADLCAITSIVNGDGTTLALTDYVTLPRNTTPYYGIALKRLGGVLWTYTTDPENAIAVTGKWAYSTTAPADIAGACVRLAAYMYRQKDNAGELDRAIVAGNATILPGQIPNDVMLTLRPYRRIT